MTLKALAALSWIMANCRHATYLLKADDDAFVNEFAAIKHLSDLAAAGYRQRLLLCLVWRRPHVERRGKWAVTQQEFNESRYPTYCSGLGYVITVDVVAEVLAAARRDAAPLWIDDVYVTGQLVAALRGRVRHTDMSAAYCKSDKMAAIYAHETEWYKYVFTQVSDRKTRLYADTWNALRKRAFSVDRAAIPTPSVVRPGSLADHRIPLSTMLRIANNIRQSNNNGKYLP